MMTPKERILVTLEGGIPDRVGMYESFWSEAIEAWKGQGLPKDTHPEDYFDLDFKGGPWIDFSFQFEEEIIEETDEYKVCVDKNGVTRKDFKGEMGHTPQWIDHKIKGGKEWYQYKDRLKATKDRIFPEMREFYEKNKDTDKFMHWGGLGPYECAWPVFGQVDFFMLMMDAPELVKDVITTYGDFLLDMIVLHLQEGLRADGIWFFEDMGYRNATLFSPQIYDEILFPVHKKMFTFVHEELKKPVLLHSCGKIETLIPRFIEAGLDAIQPLEAKTGQDVRELKKLYDNKIVFFGNMDIRKLSGTKKDVEDEILGKLPIAMENGGYIFHSDHSVPPTVSLENYAYACELVREHGRYNSK